MIKIATNAVKFNAKQAFDLLVLFDSNSDFSKGNASSEDSSDDSDSYSEHENNQVRAIFLTI